jgi:translation initiation factor eIF-2B subunit delta
MNFIKMSIASLNMKQGPEKQKKKIFEKIDYIINERIINADETIVQRALSLFASADSGDEDVVLTFGGVQLLQTVFAEAYEQKKRFRVIVADAGPDFEGREMVKRLSNVGIKVTYTLLSGISFLIDKVTKVFIGASSVLSNGAVITKVGTSMMTTIAKRHGKPVVVFTETYKFSDKVHLDPINNNEIGDPAALLSYSTIRAQKNVRTKYPLSLFSVST